MGRNIVLPSVQLMGVLDLAIEVLWAKTGEEQG